MVCCFVTILLHHKRLLTVFQSCVGRVHCLIIPFTGLCYNGINVDNSTSTFHFSSYRIQIICNNSPLVTESGTLAQLSWSIRCYLQSLLCIRSSIQVLNVLQTFLKFYCVHELLRWIYSRKLDICSSAFSRCWSPLFLICSLFSLPSLWINFSKDQKYLTYQKSD